jgi:nucleotide-binding universal stress UspA family protein
MIDESRSIKWRDGLVIAAVLVAVAAITLGVLSAIDNRVGYDAPVQAANEAPNEAMAPADTNEAVPVARAAQRTADRCVPNANLPRVPGPKPTTWCTIEAENGSAVSIDRAAINRPIDYADPYADAIIMMQPSGPDVQGALLQVRFACRRSVAQVLSADYGIGSMLPAPPGSILGAALKIACSAPGPAPHSYERQPVAEADVTNICRINGLSDQACATVKSIAAGPKPGYCAAGWARADSGLTDEQRAICNVAETYETSRLPSVPSYCQPGWGLAGNGLTEDQKNACRRAFDEPHP